jgi:hypothetical protein
MAGKHGDGHANIAMKFLAAILLALALNASASVVPLAWTQTDTNGVTGFDFIDAQTRAKLGHMDGCAATNSQVVCHFRTVIVAQACYDNGANSADSNAVTNTVKTPPWIFKK